MPKTDPRIDAYIAAAAPFARPILERLRADVHAACPECEETLKWRLPTFLYRGAILCGMGAFKAHAVFGFWKRGLMTTGKEREAMGHFGRLESIADLPGKRELQRYVRRAMALEASGVKMPRTKTGKRKPPVVPPPDLRAALARNREARETFDRFSPSHRREYVEWITEAKREETRARRVAQAVAWLAEGKPHNWRYRR